MTCRSLAPAVFVLGVAACFAGENPASGGEAALAAAREQVTQRLNAYQQIATTGTVEAIPDFWTPDGKIYETEVAMSAAELPAFAKQFFENNTLADVKMMPTETSVHDAGNSVYVFGNSSETAQAKDGKTPPSTVRCHFIMRWVKSADGQYRIQHFVAVPVPQNSEVLVGTAVAVTAPARAIDERLARQQVDQRMKDYLTIIRTGDAAGMLSFWDEGGWFFEPEMQFVSKPELAKAVEGVFAANRIISLNVNPTDIFVHDQGSVAYHFGNYEEVIEATDGKTPARTIRNNYASRWRRGPDNVWRVDRFLATPQPRPASTQ